MGRIGPWVIRCRRSRIGRTVLGMVGLSGIWLVDQRFSWQAKPLGIAATLDEAAHLATAAIIAGPWLSRASTSFTMGLVAGAVLVDVDHLPALFGTDLLTRTTARPLTHSLVGSAPVVAGALYHRSFATGALLGLASHFLRDMASSSAGVPLFWPISDRGLRLPDHLYYGVLLVALALGVVMDGRGRRSAPT